MRLPKPLSSLSTLPRSGSRWPSSSYTSSRDYSLWKPISARNSCPSPSTALTKITRCPPDSSLTPSGLTKTTTTKSRGISGNKSSVKSHSASWSQLPSTMLPIINHTCFKGEGHPFFGKLVCIRFRQSFFGHEMESCTEEFVSGPMFARRTFFVLRVEPSLGNSE